MDALKALALMALFGLVRLASPFVTIRLGSIWASRIGHFAGNTECYLCERDAGIKRPKRCIDIGMLDTPPANAQLLKMFRRVMLIWPWYVNLQRINEATKFWDWWKKHTFADAQWARDIHNLMEKSPAHLKFTRSEERRGRKALRALGIPEGAKWICLIARDSIYLKVHEPARDYSYHDFRDSNIDNYRQAVVELLKRGYYVLRMGQYVDKAMKLQGPQFIDYAVSGQRSDFMDVYLGAKCEFCISNATGFDSIPMIFRRPILYVNDIPLEYISSWAKDSLVIWKHYYKDGRRMTLKEIVASGASKFLNGNAFAQAGISLMEATPQELEDVTLEMLDRYEGKYVATPEDEALQAKFWAWFPRSISIYNRLPLHGEIRQRVGAAFLRQYAGDLDAN